MRIDKVAAQFEVWPGDQFPFAKMKIKVLERSPGDFLAVPNVAVLNRISRVPEWMSGLGTSIEDAVDDLLTGFMAEIREHSPIDGLSEADFAWSAPEDF